MKAFTPSIAAAALSLAGCSHLPTEAGAEPFRVALRPGYSLVGSSGSSLGSIRVDLAEREGPAGELLTLKTFHAERAEQASDLQEEMRERLLSYRMNETDPYFGVAAKKIPDLGFESRELPGGKGERYFYLRHGKGVAFAVTLVRCDRILVSMEKRVASRDWLPEDQLEMESLDCR